MKYEYAVFTGLIGKLEQALNERGSEGWRAISVATDPNDGTWTAVFEKAEYRSSATRDAIVPATPSARPGA